MRLFFNFKGLTFGAIVTKTKLPLYAIASGVLLSFSFPPKLFPGIEWVALVPFFLLLLLPLSNKRYFFYSWLAMTAGFIHYLWWYFDILPLDWLGVPTRTPLTVSVVGFTLFLTAAWFAVVPAALCSLLRHLAGKRFFVLVLLLLLAWPLGEYLRTLWYSLHPYIQGPGHIFGDHMAFMLLGYSVADYPAMRAMAHILGEYGISTLVLLPNLAGFTIVAIYLKRQQRISARVYKISTLQAYVGTGLLLSVFGVCLAYGARGYVQEKSGSSLWRVAVIQTNIASNERIVHNEDDRKRLTLWEQNLRALTKKALAEKPDIIVLPEGAPSIFGIETPTIFSETIPDPFPSFEQITTAIGARPYTLVVSTNLPPTWFDRHHNSTSIVDNQQGVLGTYQKRFLMPWGEYTPYLTGWVVKLFGMNWDGYRHPFVPGKGSGTIATPLGRVALRMCSELLSPQLNREAGRENADIIIFSSSTAILHGSPQLQDQTLAMAQLRAAILDKPIIYAANGGRSFALNSRGDILWQNESKGEGFAVVAIPHL